MTSKTYLQVLASQIKKMGVSATDYVQTPNTTQTNSPYQYADIHSQPGHTTQSNAIKDMQQQLLGLAQDATVKIDAQKQPVKDPVQDFMSEQYLKNNEDEGAKGVPFPNQTTKNNVVSDALEHILNINNFADGAWGPITNIALQNAYAFAAATIDMANDFKIPIRYTDNNLKDFYESIPKQPQDFAGEQQEQAAINNTKHIQAIRKMYATVKGGVTPHDQAVLSGDQAIHTYKSDLSLTPQIVSQLGQAFDNRLHVSFKDAQGNWRQQPIAIADLLTRQSLIDWRAKNAPNLKLETILDILKSTLDVMQRQETSPVKTSSFIYQDQQLLAQLMKIAQTANNSNPPANNFDLLRQLINDLQKNLTNDANTISHQGAEDVSLKPNDLSSLSSLLNFLATNKITSDGQRIAYTKQDAGAISNNDDYLAQTFGNQVFFVNKDLLTNYLHSLQEVAQKHPSPLVTQRLTARINDANNMLNTDVKALPNNSQSSTPNQQPSNINAVQLVQELVQNRPFDSETINLDAIKQFADKFAQFASSLKPNETTAQVQALVFQINSDINKAYGLMSSRSPIIQMGGLNGDLERFKGEAKTPAHALQLAGALYSVINEAGKLFQMFIYQGGSAIASIFGGSAPQIIDSLQKQVMDDGPQMENRTNLSELMNNLKEDWNKGYQR